MQSKSVTWRALLIGLILIPFNAYWVIQIEIVWYSGHPTCASLFFNTVFILVAIIAGNLLAVKFAPKVALSQGELLTIYLILCIASAISSHDMLQILIPSIPYITWFSTPENEWMELFGRYIPSWLSISDKSVLRGYYEGGSTLYTAAHLKAWLTPMLWWTSFIFALLFVMVCVNVIVRRQWTEQEKLTYPIIQLPLAITEKGGASGFFSNQLMWIGCGLAGALNVLNGLHFYFPSLPSIPVKVSQHNLGVYFTNKPWNAIGWLPLSFYPFAVGLSFFLPLDLSFSTWFFYLFRKAQQVFAAAIGLRNLPGFPYLNQQSSGAWIGLGILAVWITRRHLSTVLKRVFVREDEAPAELRARLLPSSSFVDDTKEPLPYQWAFWGLIGGLFFLIGFSVRAGMTIWAAVVFFMLYFGISTAITRMRAELGPPTHELTPMNAGHIMVDFFGTRRLGAANLTIIAFYWFFNRSYRNHPMPQQLEGFKMAERTNMDNRKLVFAMMLAVIIAVPASFWAMLHMSYIVADAPGRWFAWETFNRLPNYLNFPSPTNYPALTFFGAGFVFTFLLMAMRMRFLWWPLHPAGYALSTNFGIDYIWFCLVISSCAKWVILRYGGLKAHRNAIPFFLGLILGEFVVGGFWSVLSVILQQRTYTFWIF
ncbi:hypothetical protein FJZ31_22730 [Candidatus Poribacteria bacterium]|nr:hypothetical protein [Candidatus Poribacteria bacterium]